MPTLSGMRFAICNEIFEGWKLEDTFAYASRLGYAGVEIAPFTIANRATDISPAERQRIRAEAARNKVQITALHWVLAKTEGFHLTHPDAGVRERTADYIIELVRLASD